MKEKRLFKPIVAVVGFWGRHCPESLVRIRYLLRFKKRLDLTSPQTLNEKILYLSLRTDTSIWTRLADKYEVRNYVGECGLSEILVPLYGHWSDVEQIDFSELPNSFVLKTVQGSGDIIIVRDKAQLDVDSVRRLMTTALRTKYGELEGGKHYMRIKPAIIAEELLNNDDSSKEYSTSIIDYKIWCFNGRPRYIFVCCNRDKNGTDVMTYDLDWVAHPEYSVFDHHYRRGKIIPKPANFDRMIDVATILAKPFPVVRVDLYNLAGILYFGEMTFTSLGGLMNYYTDDFQLYAGSLIDLDYKA